MARGSNCNRPRKLLDFRLYYLGGLFLQHPIGYKNNTYINNKIILLRKVGYICIWLGTFHRKNHKD